MSVSTLEDLPFDVLDRLLRSLPDFPSLRAATLSCKALHAAYALRKKSIFDDVVKNEAGPAMRYALAVARGMVQKSDAEENGNWSRLRIGIEGDGEGEGAFWNEEVSVEDVYALEQFGVVSTAEAAEGEYSLRYKDRRVEKSVLTLEESSRFHRGFYSTWLLALLSYSNNDIDEYSDEVFALGGLGSAPTQNIDKVDFFSRLADKDLCEFAQVREFLAELYDHTFPVNIQIACGLNPNILFPETMPFEILHVFQSHEGELTSSYSILYSMFLMGINNLLATRDMEQLPKNNFGGHAIIQSTSMDYVAACQKCNLSTGWLYNNSCWSRLYEVVPADRLRDLLPGSLGRNRVVYSTILKRSSESHFYQGLIADILTQRNDPTEGWDAQEWVCGTCVVGLLKKGLIGWLATRILEDGYVFNENCLDGYYCHFQYMHEHAEKFNHLCEDTSSE